MHSASQQLRAFDEAAFSEISQFQTSVLSDENV